MSAEKNKQLRQDLALWPNVSGHRSGPKPVNVQEMTERALARILELEGMLNVQ